MVGKLNFNTAFRTFVYDLAGNLLEEGAPNDVYNPESSNEPIIDHIYLGGHRLASITGKGNVCIIATVAFGSPLASELNVFRAFRDRVLLRFAPGKAFVDWYYQDGPRVASWLQAHEAPRFGARMVLTVIAVPLRTLLFGGALFYILFILFVLVIFSFSFRRGHQWKKSLLVSIGFAFLFIIAYSYIVKVPAAMASYSEMGKYYYTEDHIGRPFSLRDSTSPRNNRWYENHYPFGEIIVEDSVYPYPITAGGGNYAISWKPSFRFPGQYEDTDQGIAYNNSSFIVQNHFREYMPQVGRYNRVDPLLIDNYDYSFSNPLIVYDYFGLLGQDYAMGLGNLVICSGIIHDQVLKKYIVYHDDALFHCVASCRIRCECPGATNFLTYAMGEEYEVFLSPTVQYRDFVNDIQGIGCGSSGFASTSGAKKCCNVPRCACHTCCMCKSVAGNLSSFSLGNDRGEGSIWDRRPRKKP